MAQLQFKRKEPEKRFRYHYKCETCGDVFSLLVDLREKGNPNLVHRQWPNGCWGQLKIVKKTKLI